MGFDANQGTLEINLPATSMNRSRHVAWPSSQGKQHSEESWRDRSQQVGSAPCEGVPAGQCGRSNVHSAWGRTRRQQTGEGTEAGRSGRKRTTLSANRLRACRIVEFALRHARAFLGRVVGLRHICQPPALNGLLRKDLQRRKRQCLHGMLAHRPCRGRTASWFFLPREFARRSTEGLRNTVRRSPDC